jgi:hypothetical protein
VRAFEPESERIVRVIESLRRDRMELWRSRIVSLVVMLALLAIALAGAFAQAAEYNFFDW